MATPNVLPTARDRFNRHPLAGANSMDNTRVVARWFLQESAILEKYNSQGLFKMPGLTIWMC